MHSSHLKEQIRLGTVAEASEENPYFGSADARADILAKLKRLRTELRVLKSAGRGPLQIYERALQAEKQQEYRTVYNMLCGDTHNSTESLENWHIDKSSPDQFRVTLFKMQKSEILHYLSSLPGVLFLQSHALVEFFGVENIECEECYQQIAVLHAELGEKAHAMQRARTSPAS